MWLVLTEPNQLGQLVQCTVLILQEICEFASRVKIIKAKTLTVAFPTVTSSLSQKNINTSGLKTGARLSSSKDQ